MLNVDRFTPYLQLTDSGENKRNGARPALSAISEWTA
jgi:hypothetical protein